MSIKDKEVRKSMILNRSKQEYTCLPGLFYYL